MKGPKKPKAPKKNADYEVGYCRPPVKNQFKKGDRANPNGRGRNNKTLMTLANELFDAKIPIQKNGAKKTVSTKEALLMRLISQALAGDRGAMKDAVNLMIKMCGMDNAQPADAIFNPLPADALHEVMRDYLTHAVDAPDAEHGVVEPNTKLEGADR